MPAVTSRRRFLAASAATRIDKRPHNVRLNIVGTYSREHRSAKADKKTINHWLPQLAANHWRPISEHPHHRPIVSNTELTNTMLQIRPAASERLWNAEERFS